MHLTAAFHDVAGTVGQSMKDGRVRSLELQFDGVFLEHQVVLLDLDVCPWVVCCQVLLYVIDVLIQVLRRGKVDDELPVGQRGSAHGAYQVVSSWCPSDGGRHVGHLGTCMEISFYALQVFLHPSAIGALGQLILHVALVVCHVGEESLAYKWESHYGEHEQPYHHHGGTPTMSDAEMQEGAQEMVYTSLVELGLSRLAIVSSRGAKQSVGHQGHMRERQNPAEQERNCQHHKEIVHIDACGIGRHEYGEEG